MTYSNPTQIELNTYLKALRDELALLLTDDLGVYEILNTAGDVITEIPAIMPEPPPFKTNLARVKDSSGIECIINISPKIVHEQLVTHGNKYLADYCLRLTQYNTSLTTQVATAKIINNKKFLIPESPVLSPFREVKDMYLYEHIDIKIRTYQYVNENR